MPDDIYSIAFIGLAALVAWLVFRKQRRSSPQPQAAGSRWTYVPLVSGVALTAITILTFGAGVLLAPVGLVLSVIAARRIPPGRSIAFWLGATMNIALGLLFLITLAIVAFDNLIA